MIQVLDFGHHQNLSITWITLMPPWGGMLEMMSWCGAVNPLFRYLLIAMLHITFFHNKKLNQHTDICWFLCTAARGSIGPVQKPSPLPRSLSHDPLLHTLNYHNSSTGEILCILILSSNVLAASVVLDSRQFKNNINLLQDLFTLLETPQRIRSTCYWCPLV
jgi:hypothetical protein